MRSLARTAYILLLVAALHPGGATAVATDNCYQYGSGGWDLIYWGEYPRLPPTPGGAIPICGTSFGFVVFRWRQPQGIFLIPSEQCPGTFNDLENATYMTLAPVSDSNEAGYVWPPPSEPGSYWITSPVPGACESGVKVRVDVISPGSGVAVAWQHQAQLPLLAAAVMMSLVLILAG